MPPLVVAVKLKFVGWVEATLAQSSRWRSLLEGNRQ